MKKILTGFCGWLILSLFPPVSAQSDLWVSVEDDVAGQDTAVFISGLLEQESVEVILHRPTESSLVIPFVANDQGVVRTSLAGIHMRTAGEYSLDVKRDYGVGGSVNFPIVAGKVSPYRSEIKIQNATIPADGEAFSLIDVFAYDAYGNPINGESVQVISSRNEDLISMESKTNILGRARGKIISNTPGISVLSVLIGNEVLRTKEEVVFHLEDTGLKNVGQGLGQFLKAQVFEESESFASLAYFDIEDFPAEVTAGQTVSVRVVVRDDNGSVLQNYDGTIRFASSDNKVELPADYTYVKEDQGVHQFFLAVRFQTPGEHEFSVHDLNNFEKKGTKSIRVLPKDGGAPVVTKPGTIELLTPEPNGVYRSSRLTITGKAPGLPVIKIRAGVAQVIIEDLPVDEDGSFVYQTPTLADGVYEFTALSIDETISSEALRVTIDRTPPSNIAVEVLPPGPKKKNELFTIRLASSEDISAASCILDEAQYELEQESETIYTKQFAAPARCGDFPVSCSVSDSIGNKLEEPNAAVIQVSCDEPAVVTPPTTLKNQAPTAPTNVSGQPGESKVTLFWSPATDDKSVSQYRVSYVENGSIHILESLVPDNRTQWYIDGLETCTEYRFTITALDEEGIESVPSEVVNQGPICNALPSAPKTVDAGSDTPWLFMLLAMLLGGSVVALLKRG